MTRSPEIIITDERRASAEAEIVEQSKRIEFYLTEYSIEALAQKVRNGDFFIPEYQREYTWEEDRKSRFIESIVMGLQIPFLFFWERDDGKLEIIDGSQRLRTLEEFILGDLRLTELTSLPKISGFRYRDLLESRQRKIRNRSIRGIILNEHADEQARFDMFERLNTGSKIANPAEVRRGALAGPFMNMVVQLAELPELHNEAPISSKLRDQREYEELVIRFFAYGDGLEGYRDRPKEFIYNYAKNANVRFLEDPELVEIYTDRFKTMLRFVHRVFPYGFRRAPSGRATPRTRFEAIAIGSALALSDRPELIDADVHPAGWLEGAEFAKITGSDGANAIARLRGRLAFVRDRLLA